MARRKSRLTKEQAKHLLAQPTGNLEDLLAFADVSQDDINGAVDWWNEHSTDEWRGLLEDEPV